MTVSKELGNGVALRQIALGGLEERELVRWVDCLVSWGVSNLVGVNDKLDVFVGELGGDLAHLDQDVARELSVEFLKSGKETTILVKIFVVWRVLDMFELTIADWMIKNLDDAIFKIIIVKRDTAF